MRRGFLKFIGAFALAAFVAGCGEAENPKSTNSLDEIKARGVVRIGVFGDKPPFGYVDKNGVNQGYDIYLAKRLAKDLLGDENKVEYVIVEAASRVEFLLADKVDIILANFTKTPERAEVVDFALPYMKVALGIVSPKNALITNIDELKDKLLIVNKGTTADAFFTKNYPNISLLKYDQNTETFNALLDGRGAALSHDNALLFAWVRENPGFEVGMAELGNIDVIAPAVKKGKPELLSWLNDEMKKLYSEKFFYDDYEATLKPFYGDSVKPETVVYSE
ncbi:cysteine ABC transporter substrate-binding protein [Campylobacter sp. 19-13652]|uniref:cysteine ABC transporter substrate-binding protein n=1 Tax=Campylobacter sp. 19-13652 TaxID=2840180 RepID=UPI001C759D29|nr:cysteine ABC transporter substrate-binding protein [Campylobacter sp. 19-13652]BCX78916.1 glutamine ABC transporter substrate-binding protein [Campylobacter sp. 19-13652]